MEGISPPSSLNLRASDLSSEWRRWIRAFEDYLLAINVIDNTKPVERRKLALFRHVGGEDVREVYSQMEFLDLTKPDEPKEIAEGDKGRQLCDVVKKFADYCNPRTSIIVQRLEFHSSKQDGEQLDVFLMRLRRVADGCAFGDQRDSLIRDKLLFGLDDVGMRDRLMRETDDKLTLDYVVKAVRVDETAKQLKAATALSQPTTASSSDINAVHGNSKLNSSNNKKQSASEVSRTKCAKCCKWHAPRKCPAYRTKCSKCSKVGHWAASNLCESNEESEVNVEKKSNPGTDVEQPGLYLNSIDINSVESQKSWYCNIKVKTVKCKKKHSLQARYWRCPDSVWSRCYRWGY